MNNKNENNIVDFLTFSSWKAQIELYGMSFHDARKIYENAKSYEKIYLEKEKENEEA